jgi:hypothetical protein
MNRHIAYLRYVLIHKWFVLVASRRFGCSLWRALVHDASKFLPDEWIPYAMTFYAADGSKRYKPTDDFDLAWLKHQRRNLHHWQAWVLRQDSGETKPMPMPNRYIREMVSDWAGAGRAITGKWEVKDWFEKNRQKMVLHPDTLHMIKDLLRIQ